MTDIVWNTSLLKVFENTSNNRSKMANFFINSFLGRCFCRFLYGIPNSEVKGLDFFTLDLRRETSGGIPFQVHAVHAYFTRAVIADMKLPDMSYFSNQ